MKLITKKDTTSKTMLIFVQDSSSTVGAGLTGLAWNSASLTWYYYREAAGTGATQVTLATQTIGTWATGGFVELDATDMPGWYEIGVPNAVLATGADFVGMVLKGATNMAQVNIEIQLTDFDLNDSVRAGLTALPNAVADGAGGLPISDAGGLDLDTKLANANEITAARMATLTDWIDGGRLDLIVDAILVDTAELQGDWAAGGRLDLILDTVAVDTTTGIPALIATAQSDLDIITGSDGVNLLVATQASIDEILADTGTDGVVLSTGTQAAIAAALLDLVDGVETGETVREALRLMRAALVGKAAGLGTTTATFRDRADTKDRITATVDVDGNRTAVTTDDT